LPAHVAHLFLYRHAPLQDLHSFPTRRSSDLFGGGAGGGPFASAGGRRSRAGRDHHAGVDIDLEEAFAGTTRTIELKRPKLKSDGDRKSTRLNSSHVASAYAVCCLKTERRPGR